MPTHPSAVVRNDDAPSAARPAAVGFPVVAVVGDGQLGRMLQPSAIELGVQLRLFANANHSSAAQVIPDAVFGSDRDAAQVVAFALTEPRAAVLTVEHEHVPPAALDEIATRGIAVHPSALALSHTRDKVVLRRRLDASDMPSPRWATITDAEELAHWGQQWGWPLVLKTPTGGYDGKGVLVVGDLAAAEPWLRRLAEQRAAVSPEAAPVLLVEEKVAFTRELAAVVARSPSGQAAAWPVVESIQVDGICREVIAPAPNLDAGLSAQATAIALRLAADLNVVGVLAVELFEVATETGTQVLINELAMRPHNSAHWSMDGAVTGQFEQHLRAILDLPLGDPSARQPWAVMVNVLGGDYDDLYRAYRHVLARDPGVKVHLYGKQVHPGRKVGHVTVCGSDVADCRARAQHAADYIAGFVTE